ncbi:hypothetical protein C8J56DRAFT_949413 [Mycena floridula]|nr:hypothetical protein C8J56DRAFT_949413 [Mycena floridula]
MAYFARPQSASAAIRIVNPNSNSQEVPQKAATRKDSSNPTICRNIGFYGSCKFQDKGCKYDHPPLPSSALPTPRSESPVVATIKAEAVNAPVFIPKSSSFQSARSVSPSSNVDTVYQGIPMDESYGYNNEIDPQYYEDPQYNGYPTEYANGGEFYDNPAPVFVNDPLDYHLYTETIPPAFVSSAADSHFVPPSSDLREVLHIRGETIRGLPPPGTILPEDLQGYHSLAPLEDIHGQDRRKLGSWYSSVYRAINSTDGAPYTLRRVENYRLLHHSAFHAIESWSKIQHPNIVSIREAFTTKAFNDSSLVVSYAYHAGAKTLLDAHIKASPPSFQRSNNRSSHLLVQSQPTAIPERTLWSYIFQIASAIKKVHDIGMAVRMIDATKILVTGQNRVRIGSCGLIDVLMHEVPQDPHALMQEDLSNFGRLILALCCNNVAASNPSNYQKSLDILSRMYSADIKSIVVFLVTKNPMKSVNNIFDTFGGKLVAEMDEALHANDRLEHELMSELENARLVRLLCKFGFINERPEFARDARWSETGDRYIIKLFRDYVFHQIDDNNNPVTNLSHVLTCLNKLDAGIDEKIMLTARDDQSCLVVSYRDIKLCVETAFNDLALASASHGYSANGYR